MIHRIFKEDLVYTRLARYGTPPKKSIKLLMSNNGGRKRVVDELQYDGIEHYLVETPEKNVAHAQEIIVQKAFLVNTANAV